MDVTREGLVGSWKECYIAGPMRGHDLWNFPAFDRWSQALVDAGWHVHSPADMDRALGLDENDYPVLPDWFQIESTLMRDFDRILSCAHIEHDAENGYGAIILLPGFEHSTGAHAELHVARNVGIHVHLAVEDEDGTPLCIPELTTDEIDDILANGPGPLPDLKQTTPTCPIDSFPVNQLVGDSDAGWSAHTLEVVRPTVRTDFYAADIAGAGRTGEPSVGDWKLWTGPIEVIGRHVDSVGNPLSGEVRITSETGGQKGTKPEQLGAIDPVALQYLGRVAAMGADKYSRFNYLKAYPWSLSVDALLRHLCLFLAGEDLDSESGLPHTAHVTWHGACLTSFLVRGIGEDDRPPPFV